MNSRPVSLVASARPNVKRFPQAQVRHKAL